MRSRRSNARGGWLPESSLPALSWTASVPANRPALSVDCAGGTTGSLARAAVPRVPTMTTTCSSQGTFIAFLKPPELFDADSAVCVLRAQGKQISNSLEQRQKQLRTTRQKKDPSTPVSTAGENAVDPPALMILPVGD